MTVALLVQDFPLLSVRISQMVIFTAAFLISKKIQLKRLHENSGKDYFELPPSAVTRKLRKSLEAKKPAPAKADAKKKADAKNAAKIKLEDAAAANAAAVENSNGRETTTVE